MMPRATKDAVTGVTPQQELFAAEFIKNGRPSLAYRRAYSAGNMNPDSVREEARRLLHNPAIALRVEFYRKQAEAALSAEVVDIVQGLARIAKFDARLMFDDDGKMLHPSEWPEDVAKAVAGFEIVEGFSGRGEARTRTSVTRKVRQGDRTRAWEVLARIRNLFGERVGDFDPSDPRTWSDDELERELAANQAAMEASYPARTDRRVPGASPEKRKRRSCRGGPGLKRTERPK